MGLTNFPNGISSFGIPIYGGGGVPTTQGNVYFVNYSTGSNSGPGNSPNNPWKTIEYAYEQAVSGNDDVIILQGAATHVLSAMLDVTKSRVHFIGLDGTTGRMYGQNAKVSLTATSGATNIATMRNLGVRNSFTNIKFINSSTVTEGIYCVAEGGEYALYTSCEFYKDTDLDQTGAAELAMNGDSSQFINCTFGSLANAIVGSIIRPCVQLTAGIVDTAKVTRDALFDGCLFWRNAGATTNVFINAANATDVERTMTLRGCGFINNGAAVATPAVAIRAASTLTVGNIVLDPNCFAAKVTKVATATGILVSGAAVNSGAGIAVNAA